jgi:hypothetical protein
VYKRKFAKNLRPSMVKGVSMRMSGNDLEGEGVRRG